MDLVRANLQWIGQMFLHQTEVTVGMLWRHAAFIGKEEMNLGLKKDSVLRMGRQRPKKLYGDAAPRKRGAIALVGIERRQPPIRCHLRQRDIVFRASYFDVPHVLASILQIQNIRRNCWSWPKTQMVTVPFRNRFV